MFQRYTSGGCKKGTKDKIGRVSNCLLTSFSLFCCYAGLPEGVSKGVRIPCVSVFIALRDTCVAGVTMTKGQAKYTCIYGSESILHIIYIHIIQIDHHGSFMRHPSLVPSHASYSFAITPSPDSFTSPPFGRSRITPRS